MYPLILCNFSVNCTPMLLPFYVRFPIMIIAFPDFHPSFTCSVPVFLNQVKDDDRAFSLGSLTIPLARLLATHELTMDQWFHLENSGSASRIYIKIVLRVGILHIGPPFFLCTPSHVWGSVIKKECEPQLYNLDSSPVRIKSVGKTLKSYKLPKQCSG